MQSDYETTRTRATELVRPSSRIAFVQDNFVQAGGGERVAEEIARALPSATVFSTVAVEQRMTPYMRSRHVIKTWMQRLPNVKKYYRHYFLLYPIAIKSLNLEGYDLVVSSCYGFAKMLSKPAGAIHVCYCHSPTRWIWRFDDYVSRENLNPVMKMLLGRLTGMLRGLDRKAADSTDLFIANSTVVAERIREYYDRDSVIMFPPIDCSRFIAGQDAGDYYVILSRMVGYKRVDLAVQACKELDRKLIVIGEGPDRGRLEAMAGGQTTFAGRLPDDQVAHLLAHCKALLFPGEEDFGLTPLEAAASGRPCVAFGKGGALDTIIDGVTGVLFPEPTVESMKAAMLRSEAIAWDRQALRTHAEKFDRVHFAEKLVSYLEKVLDERTARAA
jgi:glycosyltransferase involved in cell wall biosynthesis